MVDTPEPEKLVPIATVEARKRSCVEVIDTDEGIQTKFGNFMDMASNS